MSETRPVLSTDLSGRELLRWYWLLSELAAFARSLGVSTRGGKQELTARLVAVLDGAPPPETPRPRRRPAAALAEPLTPATVLPPGQRCTQQLRRYLVAAVGPQFSFDQAMRDVIGDGGGRTLQDVVDHWHATRGRPRGPIAAQFELNSFVQEWHTRHPGGSRVEALDAWAIHRSLPTEARQRVDAAPAS